MTIERSASSIAGIMLTALLFLGRTSIGHADEISIFMPTNVAGAPGDTLPIFGSLTNNTGSTLYFGNDSINLTAPSTTATASDDIIINGLFGSAPTSIAPGETLSGVDFFTVQILNGPGTYVGNTFQLFGGTDAVGCSEGASDCTTLLGTANFKLTVSAVPIPTAGLLLISGIGGLAGVRRRRR